MNVIALGRRAGGDAENATERAINQFEAHPDVDERDAHRLELSHHCSLCIACIHREKGEGDAIQQIHVACAEVDDMRDDPPMHM